MGNYSRIQSRNYSRMQSRNPSTLTCYLWVAKCAHIFLMLFSIVKRPCTFFCIFYHLQSHINQVTNSYHHIFSYIISHLKVKAKFGVKSHNIYTQLFERGSGRNLKSHFGAFNTQWIFLSNWNPSLKYVSTFHFLTKLVEIFCGVNVDAKAAGTKF